MVPEKDLPLKMELNHGTLHVHVVLYMQKEWIPFDVGGSTLWYVSAKSLCSKNSLAEIIIISLIFLHIVHFTRTLRVKHVEATPVQRWSKLHVHVKSRTSCQNFYMSYLQCQWMEIVIELIIFGIKILHLPRKEQDLKATGLWSGKCSVCIVRQCDRWIEFWLDIHVSIGTCTLSHFPAPALSR